MKGKALAVLREAWAALRWMLFYVCVVAYILVWLVWVVGGLRLLQDLGITAITPSSSVFIAIATSVVMAVGFIGFCRDLQEFLHNPLAFLRASLRRILG